MHFCDISIDNVGDLAENFNFTVCSVVSQLGKYCLSIIDCHLIFVCGCRWQSIFHLRIWSSVARFWNKVFLTMIIVLIVLFLGK